VTKKTNTIKSTPEESFDPATLLRDLSDIRLQIEEKKAQAEDVRRAPRTKTEAIDSFSRWVEAEASKGETQFQQLAGAFLFESHAPEPLLGYGDKAGDLDKVHIRSANSMVTYLLKDQLIQRGSKHIPACYKNTQLAIPTSEHKNAVQAVDAEIFQLECLEEKIIERAEAVGLSIFRRADATVEAVLGVGRKESLAWDFDSEVYDRVLRIAAGARAEVDQLREARQDAQSELFNVRESIRSAERYGETKTPKHLVDQLVDAEAKLTKRQTAYANAHEIVTQRVALASRLQEYVQKHKRVQTINGSDQVLKPEPTVLVDPLERAGIR